MKKILISLLLVTMLCMTACAGKSNNENKNADTSTVSNVTTTAQATTEDPHKGWTQVFGEVYIPELPFSDWEGQNQDNISCFTIFIKSNDSAKFHDYANSLTDFGYTIEKIDDYSYSGTDPDNRKISLTNHENGQMQISIYY